MIIPYFFSPEAYVHPPRVPSKRAFQRSLHESYQYMMKSMIDAANLEASRRKKLMDMDKMDKPTTKNNEEMAFKVPQIDDLQDFH